ncbi:MAG: shewanella-like protein phosphatase [Polyangiaceae bacterium]
MPFALAATLLPVACEDGPPTPPSTPPRPPPPIAKPAAPKVPIPDVDVTTRYPSARRVVAIGDVHGDLAATKAALRLGGLIDSEDAWSGGDTVVVQTGDVLDRGSDEQAILDLLLSLKEQAKATGGAVHLLQGNHELMNVAGDFRYVTDGGWADFQDAPGVDPTHPPALRFPEPKRARAAAFLPGGAYAKKIATHPVVVIVGDTVFAHGGVLPKYAGEIERINASVAAWLLGAPTDGIQVVATPDSPVWSRHFSDDTDPEDCDLLEASLKAMAVSRMVVGHTVQNRINAACDRQVWRIDVGMASHYGGTPQALELVGGLVRVLR